MIPAESCRPSRLSTVPLSGSIRIGSGALAITTPTISRSPVTSGRITQSVRGRRERVLDEPAGRLAQDDRRAAGDRQPPRLLVEGELLRRAVADVAAQDREAVGVGQVEGGAGRSRSASRISSSAAPASTGSSPGPDQRARHARDRGQAAEDLGREPAGQPSSITARHYGILGRCA